MKIIKILGLVCIIASIASYNILNLESNNLISSSPNLISIAFAQDNGENCNDCQYKVKSKTCVRYVIKYDSNGKQVGACLANGTKITCPSGTGSCSPGCDASC